MADYIPGSDGAFDNWEGVFVTYVFANAVALGVDPLYVAALSTARTGWSPSGGCSPASWWARGGGGVRGSSVDPYRLPRRHTARGARRVSGRSLLDRTGLHRRASASPGGDLRPADL